MASHATRYLWACLMLLTNQECCTVDEGGLALYASVSIFTQTSPNHASPSGL